MFVLLCIAFIFYAFFMPEIMAFSCPKGTTNEDRRGNNLNNNVLGEGHFPYRIYCDKMLDTYVKTDPISLPDTFSIQLWIRHTGCLSNNSHIRTIIHKPGHLLFVYNAQTDQYEFSYLNESYVRTSYFKSRTSIIFNKWEQLILEHSLTRIKFCHDDKILVCDDDKHSVGGNKSKEHIFIGTKNTIEKE